jgi:hypothetical protein
MGMGPAFDPRGREKRELLRRARKLLRTHGVVEVATNGQKSSHAATGVVRVRQDPKGMTIRYYREASHPLMSWPRVLSRDRDGYEKLWNEPLLVPALEHLRRLQVLDDIAEP